MSLIVCVLLAADFGQASPIECRLPVELVAVEPQVVDPVAIRFDARGRLWVVEMRDYPLGPEPGEPLGGRIRILTDTDGDGRFETATTFADGLDMPTGVQPWREGCVATVAGEVVFLDDTDFDGRADTRTTWITGLATGNEQLRANHPTIGPDGWLTVCNGLRTATVQDARFPNSPPVAVRGRDFRLHLSKPRLEPVTGHGQHGQTFDRWGRRFVCSNARPCDYGVVPHAVADSVRHVRDLQTVDEVIPGNQRRPVHPLIEQFTTSIRHTGSFTAACGIHAPWTWPGGQTSSELPMLICEPTGSLVHAEWLRSTGASFAARPMDADTAFLASTDRWFRPVDLATGPDGRVYVCDFHRPTIEHPEWMNDDLKARSEFTEGRDRGRIYAVGRPRPWSPVEDPIATLADGTAGQWQVGAAWQQLAELGSGEEVTAAVLTQTRSLRDRVFNTEQASERDIAGAVRLAQWLAGGESLPMPLLHGLTVDVALHGDDAATAALIRLRRAGEEAPWSLGDPPGPESWFAETLMSEPWLNRWWTLPADDPWTAQAIQIVADRTGIDTLDRVESGLSGNLREADTPTGPLLAIVAAASELVGRKQPSWDAIRFGEFRSPTPHDAVVVAAAVGLCRAGRGRRLPADDLVPIASELAGDATQPGQALAVELIGHLASSTDPLVPYLIGRNDRLREIALTALAGRGDLPMPDSLFGSLGDLPAAAREQLLDAMVATPERSDQLLTAIESGQIRSQSLGPMRADRLREHPDDAVRTRARQLLPTRESLPDAVWQAYLAALSPDDGDSERGRRVFVDRCANCHRVDGVGKTVGPSLSDLRTKSREQVLEAILKPNAAIDAAYVAHVARADDGRVYHGVIAAETDAAVTLRGADGRDIPLLRDELDGLQSTGLSLMPERLDLLIAPDEMSDLVHWLKTWRFE